VQEIVLSICIPTYNRSEYLIYTIESIVNQRIFINTNMVEVIIGDNNSTDDTENRIIKYVEAHNNKIKYFKNEKNIFDKNYDLVISKASGLYIKLNNDTLIHEANSLEFLLGYIKKYKDKNIDLIFTNKNIRIKENVEGLIKNKNDYVNNLGPLITWIGIYGIWRKNLNNIQPMYLNSDTQLSQVIGLLQSFEINNKSMIIDGEYAKSYIVAKGGYQLFEVFVTNFEKILKKQNISEKIIKNVMKRTIFNVVTSCIAMHWVKPKKYKFEIKNIFLKILIYFKGKGCISYYAGFITYTILKYIRNIIKGIPLEKIKD
jgi:abequosyltransferase